MQKKIVFIICFLLIILSTLFGVIHITKNQNSEENPTQNQSQNDDSNKEKDYEYMLIDNISNWRYYNNEWIAISDRYVPEDKFKVYYDNKYAGTYEIKRSVVWDVLDENGNVIRDKTDLLAISINSSIKVRELSIEQITDIEFQEIQKIINRNLNAEELSTNEVVKVDLNSNGIIDKIVNVSDAYSEIEKSKYFNLIYVVLDNKVKVLINEDIPSKEVLSSPLYNIRSVLNIRRDNYDNILIRKRFFSLSGESGNILYGFQDNEYQGIFND